MVTIRTGKMKDCSDLLEVYQGTRWFYKQKDSGYTTVEQVKDEHRGVTFENWGWLVAEQDGHAVGEIVVRLEKNPIVSRVGIIRNLDIDVRHQKKTIGTQLTHAAEDVLKKKKVVRVIATTPPAAYNYWMKVKYFARGSIVNLKTPLGKIPEKRNSKIKTEKIDSASKLPKSLKFSHIAYPGALAELAGDVIDGRLTGRLFEYHAADKLIGVGVIAKKNSKSGVFVADVTKRGLEFADAVISRTARAASIWKLKSIETTISKDHLGIYSSVAKWSSELSTDIPVTKLL
ncbi:GNAT family N-acetyltransferase [Candidatus Thorarchaeota archaeon]|nr:MAG: GNAT family N-acetyltransferase [Candidatus Thorarchaeota archaeon]